MILSNFSNIYFGTIKWQGILESAIKITNEPPTGMRANIHKALDNFNQDTLESCAKETEFKAILFTLCYYHAALAERRKFGAQGWNRVGILNFTNSRFKFVLNHLQFTFKIHVFICRVIERSKSLN